MVEQEPTENEKSKLYAQRSCELIISEFGRAYIHPIITKSLMNQLFINFYDKSSKPKGGNFFHAGFVNIILSMQRKEKVKKSIFEEMFKNGAYILKEFMKQISIEEIQEIIVNSFEHEDNQREPMIKLLFDLISEEKESQGACVVLATLIQQENQKVNNFIKKYLTNNFSSIVKSTDETQFESFLQFFLIACQKYEILQENLYILCDMMKKPPVIQINLIY